MSCFLVSLATNIQIKNAKNKTHSTTITAITAGDILLPLTETVMLLVIVTPLKVAVAVKLAFFLAVRFAAAVITPVEESTLNTEGSEEDHEIVGLTPGVAKSTVAFIPLKIWLGFKVTEAGEMVIEAGGAGDIS